jgi:hypothetical protein
MLKHLSERYDFYFPTGEGYFDEQVAQDSVGQAAAVPFGPPD